MPLVVPETIATDAKMAEMRSIASVFLVFENTFRRY
jgi:hypothetical protein